MTTTEEFQSVFLPTSTSRSRYTRSPIRRRSKDASFFFCGVGKSWFDATVDAVGTKPAEGKIFYDQTVEALRKYHGELIKQNFTYTTYSASIGKNQLENLRRTLSASGRLQRYFQIQKRLNSLGQLASNWDGYSALPIDSQILAAAESFAFRFSPSIQVEPAVVPMSGGRLQFEWYIGEKSVELEFETAFQIHYLLSDDESDLDEEGLVKITDEDRLKSILNWLFDESQESSV